MVKKVGEIRQFGETLELVQAEEPKHRLPRWVRKLTGVYTVPFDSAWIHEPGTLVDQAGNEYFVSEPWGLSALTCEALWKDSHRFKFEFAILAGSYIHPTRTVRIICWPTKGT